MANNLRVTWVFVLDGEIECFFPSSLTFFVFVENSYMSFIELPWELS